MTTVVLSVVIFSMLSNDPPVITGLEARSERVSPGGSTEIACTASSPGRRELRYEWSASGGEIQGTGANVTWMAPDSAGIYSVTITVSDSRGGEDSSELDIHVRANRAPTITRLTPDATWTAPGGSIRVTCEAQDADGDDLSHLWSATAGTIEDMGETIEWTAPEHLGTCSITVVVSDPYGGSVADTLSLSVTSMQPPVIESLLVEADGGHKYLRETDSGYEVGEGRVFLIRCAASHPDGLELSYEWDWDDGEVSETPPGGAMITWTAPYERGALTITVSVSDIYGTTVSQSVKLEVVSCSRFG